MTVGRRGNAARTGRRRTCACWPKLSCAALAYPRHEPWAPVSVPQPVPAAAEGMNRVEAPADALAAVGAIDVATADSVVTGLASALAARSKVAPLLPHRRPVAQWNMRLLPAPALPGGPVRIVPVGKSAATVNVCPVSAQADAAVADAGTAARAGPGMRGCRT